MGHSAGVSLRFFSWRSNLRPHKSPGNSALAADGQHSRALPAGVAFEPGVEVVGQADVMAGVAQRLI
jgi:hypothetical protein